MHWKRWKKYAPRAILILLGAIAAGILTPTGNYLVPRWLKKKELTYYVFPAEPVIHPMLSSGLGGIKFQEFVIRDARGTNPVTATNLFLYRFWIKNSGRADLPALTVRYDFDTKSKNFQIVGAEMDRKASTRGVHRDIQEEQFHHDVTYKLLKAGAEDHNFFITTEMAPLSIISHTEDLKVKQVALRQPSTNMALPFALMLGLGFFLALNRDWPTEAWKWVRDKLQRKEPVASP